MVNWKSKYLEMKLKYVNAKNQKGGSLVSFLRNIQTSENYNCFLKLLVYIFQDIVDRYGRNPITNHGVRRLMNMCISIYEHFDNHNATPNKINYGNESIPRVRHGIDNLFPYEGARIGEEPGGGVPNNPGDSHFDHTDIRIELTSVQLHDICEFGEELPDEIKNLANRFITLIINDPMGHSHMPGNPHGSPYYNDLQDILGEINDYYNLYMQSQVTPPHSYVRTTSYAMHPHWHSKIFKFKKK